MALLSRRAFFARTEAGMGTAGLTLCLGGIGLNGCAAKRKRPNILLAISDDQSWLHTGTLGCRAVHTPAFDRIAAEGVLCSNAFCTAPQCSPNRASLLTGRHLWQNAEAGTHASSFPRRLIVYPDLLENAGYAVGFTGKPWGPGNWRVSGWPRNPVGEEFNQAKTATPPSSGIARDDYAANFKLFLAQIERNRPFCFWYGCQEPHRDYERGSGLNAGKKLEEVVVPPFLPDTEAVRSDLLDYLLEIEWFDRHLAEMMNLLAERGELDDTLIIVTSDNGMPFPRAKANLYEFGVHLPLAVRYPAAVPQGRRIDDLISFVDLAPTLLEAAGLAAPDTMTGRSIWPLLTADKCGILDSCRDHVLFGRERHTHARPDNLGYPSRAIRTHQYLYIWNIKPERWPVGDPQGFYDVDASPSKEYILEHRSQESFADFFALAFGVRSEEELYDVTADPACLNNLAQLESHASIRQDLRARLESQLQTQGDPRMNGSEVFESYPRFSPMRMEIPGFKEQNHYNLRYRALEREDDTNESLQHQG